MRILITGGTGFIGQHLVDSLIQDKHQVTILSRRKKESNNPYISYRQWDAASMPAAIGLYDVVINLAGASLADNKWTDAYKQLIVDSRINATRACVDYINSCEPAPKLFLSASAIGIYGGLREQEVDESASLGDDFMAQVCSAWEDAAEGANCRTVKLRISVILGKDGGALPQMLTPYKLGLGGRFASGQQGMSWMHIDDLIQSIRFVMAQEEIEGPINLSAPNWHTQENFSKTLASSLHRPHLFVIPKFMLKMIFGEQSVLFWGGQKVKPTKLMEAGFEFKYDTLEKTFEDLL